MCTTIGGGRRGSEESLAIESASLFSSLTPYSDWLKEIQGVVL